MWPQYITISLKQASLVEVYVENKKDFFMVLFTSQSWVFKKKYIYHSYFPDFFTDDFVNIKPISTLGSKHYIEQ